MNIKEWQEAGQPANTPFNVRHNPEPFLITQKEMAAGFSERVSILSKKFIGAYVLTCQHYGAKPIQVKGIHQASEKLGNVVNLVPGVYSYTQIKDLIAQMSFIGWMSIRVPVNGEYNAEGHVPAEKTESADTDKS